MRQGMWRMFKAGRAVCTALVVLLCLPMAGCAAGQDTEEYTANTFAMDTLVTQHAFGGNAQQAMRVVNETLAEWEARLSLYGEDGDIAKVNASAGGEGVQVSPETAALLSQALALSTQSGDAFQISIAPLTLAWGITSDAPRVPPQQEIEGLLPLVDDGAVVVQGNLVTLPKAGMALDLGGIAKGAVCAAVQDVYEQYGVNSAWISIGGNIYARGAKPDGTPFRMGFADPTAENAYIASFELQDAVVAVSGGYERYFEVDGQRYIHIIDPRTGYPAQSNILSVGVIHPDGAEADFWSTTLFVWGRERALEYMQAGGRAILLDDAGTLYVSEGLRDSFKLYEDGAYPVVYVEEVQAA